MRASGQASQTSASGKGHGEHAVNVDTKCIDHIAIFDTSANDGTVPGLFDKQPGAQDQQDRDDHEGQAVFRVEGYTEIHPAGQQPWRKHRHPHRSPDQDDELGKHQGQPKGEQEDIVRMHPAQSTHTGIFDEPTYGCDPNGAIRTPPQKPNQACATVKRK